MVGLRDSRRAGPARFADGDRVRPAPIMTPPPAEPARTRHTRRRGLGNARRRHAVALRAATPTARRTSGRRRSGRRAPRPIRNVAQEPAQPKRVWASVAAGVGAIALIAGIYFAFFNEGPSSQAIGRRRRAQRAQDRRLPRRRREHRATLREALSKAGPGDTIVDRRAEARRTELSARSDQAQGPDHRVRRRPTASRR